MSDQTLKLAQRLIPHLGLLQHVMDLKTLAALSPLMKPPVRAALISPTSIMLVGPELTSAPLDSAQIAVCYRLVAQFKGHDGQEYAITNGELRASLTREHSRLLTDPATLDLHHTLQGIAATLGAEPGEATTRPPAPAPSHPTQDSAPSNVEPIPAAPVGTSSPDGDSDTIPDTDDTEVKTGPDEAVEPGAETDQPEPGETDTDQQHADPAEFGTEHAGETQATSTQEDAPDSQLDEQIGGGSILTEDQSAPRGEEPSRNRRRRP